MKHNIKNILAGNHDAQTKGDLVKLLTSFSELIGQEAYQKISGVDPKTELDKLTKKEIVSVLNDFNTHYNSAWEDNLTNATGEIIKGIFGQMEADEKMFEVMAASDADFAAELGSIDFENLIGGPLNAAVSAQNNASLATVSFIKEVGFKDGEVRMVDFSYTKQVPQQIPDPSHTDPNTPAPLIDDPSGATRDEKVKIFVPFISVLNVPSLRIETVDIDFNVKLNSVFTKDLSSELKLGAEVGGKVWGVKFKVTASYKRTSSTGIKVEKEYNLGVKVKATNDEMPAGLEKVLGLLAS